MFNIAMESAVRASEIVLAIAYVQQSLEYIRGQAPEKYVGWVRLILSVLLLAGIETVFVETGLLLLAGYFLYRFKGPYNGGSDAMSVLVLLCLWLSHMLPTRFGREMALGYLAFQASFSYFQAGYIKIINPAWRTGDALREVFAFTAYPVSDSVRNWSRKPKLLWLMGWSVILFELMFPFALFHQILLVAALVIAVLFHLANACLFGLNRFFWIWPASYPILLWFQDRIF